MGQFINELKRRGAYLYGSRVLGVSTVSSDFDWALPFTDDNIEFLRSHKFMSDLERVGRCRYSRPSGRVPSVVELPGLQGETMYSYRKGITNVVLMSPKLFAATRYATQMAAAHKDDPLLSTKEGRVELYQRYSTQFARMNAIELPLT